MKHDDKYYLQLVKEVIEERIADIKKNPEAHFEPDGQRVGLNYALGGVEKALKLCEKKENE